MTPRWERIAAPPPHDDVVMDAVLRPNRSLSAKAFKWMLIAVIAINVGLAAAFIAQGAYPVAGFLGFDVLALYIAFRINYRAGRALERVRVGPERIVLERCDANGRAALWAVSTLWARVSADERSVVIASGGGAMRVGAFLSPDERSDFAKALDAALWRARRESQKSSTSRME